MAEPNKSIDQHALELAQSLHACTGKSCKGCIYRTSLSENCINMLKLDVEKTLKQLVELAEPILSLSDNNKD